MNKNRETITSEQKSILNALAVAVTITDLTGTVLFYNDCAPGILDRKPEYIGRDIRACHKNPESIRKIDSMLLEFQRGRKEPFSYTAQRKGARLVVTFSPFSIDGAFAGLVQVAARVSDNTAVAI
ncbi:MAG: PAS domain-containing protein [Desulfomonilaceae bacterium]